MKFMISQRTNQLLFYISIAMILAALVLFIFSPKSRTTIFDGAIPLAEMPVSSEESQAESMPERVPPVATENSAASGVVQNA